MDISDFLRHLRLEKRFSEHTIKAYHNDLIQYNHYLEKNYKTDINQTDSNQIRRWLSNMMEEGISTKSINRKISSLKSYFNHLESYEMINENPMSRVSSPKNPAKLAEFVSEYQMKNMFDQLEFSDNFTGVRDRLIMEILYSTGIRLSELIHIKENDLDLGNSTVKISGKGNKERLIPLLDGLVRLIKDYLQQKRTTFHGIDATYLLVTNKGKKLYPRFVYRVVNSYLSVYTTADKQSPHVLRHTFATHMLNNGADINAIKELLGHASLSATQIYTHNTVDKLKSIYKQAHPRA